MSETFDELDKKILNLLKKDGRLSFNQIAMDLSKSESTIRKRIKRLISDKIIEGFTIKMNNHIEGNLLSYLRINTESNDFESILNYISNRPEAIEVYKISGAYPIICKLLVNSMAEMEDFVVGLKEVPGVKEIENSIIINKIKG